ncbi:diaminopimelate epimerase [Lutispora thermophila]|uniref:Diaminopimelate epimerase n=1 Tax=Lutispora thermophila DSM 19022 TaxID=1122184 RepID=A0A1M6GGW1_9FIRM|nr:diaminopimelate epimerase [Lutispora thermophila]SHJ09200.1 diaminopimelate epimerase [Lutispora thermophila DSM 19022]
MEFTKMEAAGNDFVVFNGFKYEIKDYEKLALKACDRHFSVGADGILVCEGSDIADIKMIYYNSDGSRGEMCGNGIRCFSKYVYEEGLIDKKIFTVDTLAGIKTIWIETDNENKVKTVKVNMGKPLFRAKDVPVDLNKEKIIEETIDICGEKIVFSSLLVGVPHTVIFVDDIRNIDINELGKKIETHCIFPRKTNVNFVEVVDRDKINIYTWERGAGRTLGCGTGSCASVVIGNIIGKLNNVVNVKTEGGELEVQIGEDLEIYMKGGANRICDGVFLKLT